MHQTTSQLSNADLREIMETDSELWSGLKGAHILVTGATGFFGRWLLESFAYINREQALGASLVAVTRDPEAFRHAAPHLANDPAISLHRSDVRHFQPPAGNVTHIIHAATESCGAQQQHTALHMVETIIDGTRHVLDFAKAQGRPRVLYVSSGAIYGAARAEPMQENDNTAPRAGEANIEYSESKRMAEALCQLYHRSWDIPITIARGFSFVGPFLPLNAHFAIGNFIADALHKNAISIKGDGTAIRSYLYMTDLTRWLWTILLRGQSGHAYNVGSEDAISIKALAEHVKQVINPATTITIAQQPAANAPLLAQVPATRKAREELGLTQRVSLAEAIRRTADWHRAQPAAPTTAPASSLKHIQAIIFDFDGVMTDNRVAVMQNGEEAVFCNRSDGLGIDMLKKHPIALLILSKEKNPVVGMRAAKLGIECLQGIDDKQAALSEWLRTRGYQPEHTAYLGNDINDLEAMRIVGWPVAVGDAYPQVKQAARLVLSCHGGHGAVRELADIVLAARSES